MGFSTEMLVCEDMTLCTDLAHRHVVDEQQLLYSCSKYVSAVSCKAMCGVALVRTLDYSRPFWLK